MSDEMGEGMQKVVEQIRKLMAHAAGTTNMEESATFTAKAQEMLLKHNLDAALIEQAQGRIDGKREDAKLDGGFYLFQRELYEAVAKLNFCMYFTEDYVTVRDKTIKRGKARYRYDPKTGDYIKGQRIYAKGDKVIKKRHRIIGRQVNTAATQSMATYIEQSIERIIRDRLAQGGGKIDFSQLYSNWGISFREGAVSVLVEKIESRRRLQIKAEEAKRRAAEKTAMGKASSATGLTIADLTKSEEAANYDFVYGEGAWAEGLAMEARAAARWKKELDRRAKLAKDDPAKAKAEEEERRKESRGRSWSGPRERSKDYSAYRAGHEAADRISIDPQAGHVAKAGYLK